MQVVLQPYIYSQHWLDAVLSHPATVKQTDLREQEPFFVAGQRYFTDDQTDVILINTNSFFSCKSCINMQRC